MVHSQSSNCSLSLQSETVQHVISSCKFLDEGRFTWRHNSLLFSLANALSSLKQSAVYADLPSFLSLGLITGESFRPDLLLTDEKILYVLEITVRFETNIQNNSNRKASKYSSLINDLSPSYSKVLFANLSVGAVGLMGSSKANHNEAMNISVRSNYCICCRRNKPRTKPELLTI